MIEAMLMGGSGMGINIEKSFNLGVFQIGNNSLLEETIALPFSVDPERSVILGKIEKPNNGATACIYTPSFSQDGGSIVFSRYSSDNLNYINLQIVELSASSTVHSGTVSSADATVSIDLSSIISDRNKCIALVFARRDTVSSAQYIYSYYIDSNDNLIVEYSGADPKVIEWKIIEG